MQQTKKRIAIFGALAIVVVGACIGTVSTITTKGSRVRNGELVNSINGQIVDQNNKPVRFGAAVHVCGNACFEATPSLVGTFSVSDIPTGHYAVYGEHKSCKSLEYTLSIVDGETIDIPFALMLDQCS